MDLILLLTEIAVYKTTTPSLQPIFHEIRSQWNPRPQEGIIENLGSGGYDASPMSTQMKKTVRGETQ